MKYPNIVYPLIGLILIILSGFIGYRIGYTQYKSNPTALVSSSNSSQAASLSNAIFAKQSATIQGKITKLAGNTASVINNTNNSGDFPVAKDVVVYTLARSGGSGSSAIGISNIPLNQSVVISLDLVGSSYQIISIFPTPQLNSPSVVTSSPKPSKSPTK